jgi:hypothetical protein
MHYCATASIVATIWFASVLDQMLNLTEYARIWFWLDYWLLEIPVYSVG